MICTQNSGHIDLHQAEQLDVILYFTGGIQFVFFWILLLL